jgi:polar amino acid transport system permease protein
MRARAVAALAAALLLAGCTRVEYTWAWHIVSPTTAAGRTNLWYLTEGLGLTIELSVVSIAVSMGLGLVVALAGFSRNRTLLAGHRCYIEALPPAARPWLGRGRSSRTGHPGSRRHLGALGAAWRP